MGGGIVIFMGIKTRTKPFRGLNGEDVSIRELPSTGIAKYINFCIANGLQGDHKRVLEDELSKRNKLFSFSRIQTFNQCKYQYYQTYVVEKDSPEKLRQEDNAFSQFGTLCHKILEQCARGELEVYELMDEYEKRFGCSVNLPFSQNSYSGLDEKYYMDGLAFFEEFDGFDGLDILWVEKEFLESVDDDFYLKGVIDLVYKDSSLGSLVVHDWKSKSKLNKKDEKKFKRQLYIYSLHTYRENGYFPNVLRLYLFRKQRAIDITFNKDEFNKTLEWLKASVKEIRACTNWEPQYDYFYCHELCSFRNSCPYAKGGDEK